METEKKSEKNPDVLHYKAGDKVFIENAPFRFRHDVKGEFGCVEARGFVDTNRFDFRFELKDKNASRIKNEGITLVRLNKNGSNRAIRIYQSGDVGNVHYLLTSRTGRCFADVLKDLHNLEPYVYTHIVRETFLSIQEIHEVNCAHFDIQPSSFSLSANTPSMIVFSGFTATVRLKLVQDYDKEKKVRIAQPNRFTSRRQHKGQRLGIADDFESWIYMIYEVVHDKKLEWATATNNLEMLYKKWLFLKEYTAPPINKDAEKKIRYMIDVIWSCNAYNTADVDGVLSALIKEWYDTSYQNGKKMPWEK
ncbi:unnamed protein product [Caenorhabditis angaria]|uniref:Protein kinase domain-containing protein n=1 Tax=Caenorhabditis angaria TaxID=860376 RepID=A0A9P1IH20_9PELO|nr:unnamed protein product [Caenorhabditis angaria]